MSTPLKQKLTKSTISSPNRFQPLSQPPFSPSPSPSPKEPSSYLQVASTPLSTQDFPPFPRALTPFNPNPRFQILAPSSSSSPSKIKTQYFTKSKKEYIIILEPEFHNLNNPNPNFLNISNKVFYKDSLFLESDITKNRKFYEHVLVDSGSVEIEHNFDSKDTSRITYSKIRIIKVLVPSDMNNNLYTSDAFSNSKYNYIDYKNAWFYTFFVRPFNHSWFVYWCKNIPTPLPQWFFHWWTFFGLAKELLPSPILQGYEHYKKNYAVSTAPSLLTFSMHFSIPWIVAWTFQVEEVDHIKWLTREFNVKWWSNFKNENADFAAVVRWIKLLPKIPTAPPPEDFKSRKQRLQMALANVSNEEEFQNIITELSSFNSDSTTEKADSDNEDNIPADAPDFFSQYY